MSHVPARAHDIRFPASRPLDGSDGALGRGAASGTAFAVDGGTWARRPRPAVDR